MEEAFGIESASIRLRNLKPHTVYVAHLQRSLSPLPRIVHQSTLFQEALNGEANLFVEMDIRVRLLMRRINPLLKLQHTAAAVPIAVKRKNKGL